jgi:hypothetical protein
LIGHSIDGVAVAISEVFITTMGIFLYSCASVVVGYSPGAKNLGLPPSPRGARRRPLMRAVLLPSCCTELLHEEDGWELLIDAGDEVAVAPAQLWLYI